MSDGLIQQLPFRQGELLPVADIYDGDRLRPVDADWVAALGAQFETAGQEQPIVVRPRTDADTFPHPYALVIGAHRHAAAVAIGWSVIRAEVREYEHPLRARLAEIDENLIRHELNPLDRAFFLDERRRVHAALYPETQHGGDRKSGRAIKSQGLRLDPRRFSREAAERCGFSERTVQASLKLAASLAPEAIAHLRGTPWARNGSELQRLSMEPADRQVALASLHARGGAATVAAGKIASGFAPTGESDPQEELFRRLCSTWERLDAKGRKRFLDHAGLAERKPRERMPKVGEIVPEIGGRS